MKKSEGTAIEMIRDQILKVRDTGLVNMFDILGVKRVAAGLGLRELLMYLDEDIPGYIEFIYRGE